MTSRRPAHLAMVVATAIAFGGCAAIRRQEARDTGDLLAAAGFRTKLADTPEREQQLHSMPPLKVVAQSKDGKLVYRYADPYDCQCLYVGDESAYAQFKRLALERELANERVEAAAAADSSSIEWDLWGW